jgi:hypothetical protein
MWGVSLVALASRWGLKAYLLRVAMRWLKTSLVYLFVCRWRDLAVRNHDNDFFGTDLGKDRHS